MKFTCVTINTAQKKRIEELLKMQSMNLNRLQLTYNTYAVFKKGIQKKRNDR